MNAHPLTEALRDLVPSALSTRIARAFEYMKITEEEIRRARALAQDDAVAHRLHASFGLLWPGELLNLTPEVYRHHCRELLGRIERGDDVRPGTDAEVLWMLVQTSLAAPLNANGCALYDRLFVSIFGRLPPECGEPTREPWPGAAEEMLHGARRRLAKDR